MWIKSLNSNEDKLSSNISEFQISSLIFRLINYSIIRPFEVFRSKLELVVSIKSNFPWLGVQQLKDAEFLYLSKVCPFKVNNFEFLRSLYDV